jgi:predicted RNA-binding protein
MCEFKVLIKNEEVYDDVIYAKLEGEAIVLRDVLGVRKTIPSAIIEEVDVQAETLKLRKDSIVGKLLVFLSMYDELASKGMYSEEIERLWEEIKGEGEAMVKRLWTLTHK